MSIVSRKGWKWKTYFKLLNYRCPQVPWNINRYDEGQIFKYFSSFRKIYTKEIIIDDWVVLYPGSHDIESTLSLVKKNKGIFKKYLLLAPENPHDEISVSTHQASTFVINKFVNKYCGFYVENVRSKYTMTFSNKKGSKAIDTCKSYPTILGITNIGLNYEISNFVLNGNI